MPFKKITYNKAIDILRFKECKIKEDENNRLIEWGDDLNIESERELTKDKENPILFSIIHSKLSPFM